MNVQERVLVKTRASLRLMHDDRIIRGPAEAVVVNAVK